MPAANAFLPTDTRIELTYAGQAVPARFEATFQHNGNTVAPFRYPIGGKEYYVSTADSVAFAGFYAIVVVEGGDEYTVDARFDTTVTLLDGASQAQRFVSVGGTGTVTILPDYGALPLTYSGRVAYLGTEPIATPYGTLESKHIRLEVVALTTIEEEPFSLPLLADYWLVRGIGIVQRVEEGQLLELAELRGPDGDSDSVFDGLDAFPADPSESRDLDGDGVGDNGDTDDDGDAVADANDRFPRDAAESVDFDADGIGDNGDPDDDDDGVYDVIDPFPRDIHNTDTDSDGTQDFYDADDDDDTFADAVDRFPLNANEWLDNDNDGTGDNGDFDDDNDGAADDVDAYPFNPARSELLTIDRAAISLSTIYGSAVSPAGFFEVRGDQISWQVESSVPWLALDTPNGTIGDAYVLVQADALALDVGTHTAQVTVRDLGDARALLVDVTVTVTLPVLSTTLDHVSFDGTFGWSELTRPIDVTLNTGLNQYPITLELSFPMADAIEATLISPPFETFPGRLNVTLDPAKLRSGRHAGTLTLRTNVLGQVITRSIAIEAIASQRVVYPSADGVAFVRTGAPPDLFEHYETRTIRVLDSYRVAGTPWTASSDQPWLNVTPSGVTGGALTLTLTAEPTGLADGLHWATVSISSSDGNVEAIGSVRVSLWQQLERAGSDGSLPAVYRELASDPVRPYVYAHNGSSTIDVYHVHAHTLETPIAGLSGVLGPMVTSTDGRWLFVLDPTNGSVTRIDLDDTNDRVTWPLLEGKPFGEPRRLVYARPSGHHVLLLNDGRVVDAETGSVFPSRHTFSLPDFDIAKASSQEDRVCVLQQTSPFSGACFSLLYGDQGTPDVRHSALLGFSGFDVPNGGGVARDLAMSADGDYFVVGLEQSATPLVKFNVWGSYLGTVPWGGPNGPTIFSARAVAVTADDAVLAYVIDGASGSNQLWLLRANGLVPNYIEISNGTPTGLFAQLVVSGDTAGSAFLTGVAPPLPTESSTIHFLRAQ